jgi:hypothetical protein
LLNPKSIPWRDLYEDKMNKSYCEARAWLGKGDLEKAAKSIAAHAALKKDLDKNKDQEDTYTIEALELKGRFAIARGETGDTIVGLELLADAAGREYDMQKAYADPPFYPQSLYNSLGEAYMEVRSPVLAARGRKPRSTSALVAKAPCLPRCRSWQRRRTALA